MDTGVEEWSYLGLALHHSTVVLTHDSFLGGATGGITIGLYKGPIR